MYMFWVCVCVCVCVCPTTFAKGNDASTPVFLPGVSSWTGEPGGLQSMGSQRVRHNWKTKHIMHCSPRSNCWTRQIQKWQNKNKPNTGTCTDSQKDTIKPNQTTNSNNDISWVPCMPDPVSRILSTSSHLVAGEPLYICENWGLREV